MIARNRLTIVTAKGNPKHVEGLDDLDSSDLRSCWRPRGARRPLRRAGAEEAGVDVKPVSEEPNVRAVLSKVTLGEADAGIVYVTDATVAKGKVDTVTVPDGQNAVASYPAATLNESKHADDAADFVKWLSTDESQKLLRAAGFQKP
ncbi:extracellular solute-binding protein [Streptomyces sp. M19]